MRFSEWTAGLLITLTILAIGLAVAILNTSYDSYSYSPCDTSSAYLTADSTSLMILMAVFYLSFAGFSYGFYKKNVRISIASACLLTIAIILATLPPAYACM
jgi:hypothetical protein